MASKFSIGALIYDQFEVLDFYGPLEMFGMSADVFPLTIVAENEGPVAAHGGSHTLATQGFATPPDFDIILIPGGRNVPQDFKNAALVDWIDRAAERAQVVATVCTASGLLAATGRLDGRPATTNKALYDIVTATRPQVNWVHHARWVDDGDIITSSGVSAGTDMSLALIARLLGRDKAEAAAKGAEYIWNDDPSNDPFAGD